MLDLGGGHGLYAIALARLNPGMQCVVFDLPQVGEAARISLAKYGVENQVSIRAGDFFRDDFGRGYDLILSSSNPSGKKTEMVPRIADALNPGGYFVNVQGGDASKKNDCVAELECRMWRFSDEPEWRTRDGKRRPFVSDDYRELWPVRDGSYIDGYGTRSLQGGRFDHHVDLPETIQRGRPGAVSSGHLCLLLHTRTLGRIDISGDRRIQKCSSA